MSTLLAVDGDNIAMTALHVVHARNDGADEMGRQGAVLDLFLSMLTSRIRIHSAERVAVCWDDPAGSWRHTRWAGYKASRASSLDPDGRNQAYTLIRHVLRQLGIRQVQAEGYEADDLVAGFWRGARPPVDRVMIFSGDNDYAQLLDPGTVQVKPDNPDRLYDADWVFGKYKVEPREMPLYKALVGDTSDGIPGARNVGPKRALVRMATALSPLAVIEGLPVTERDDVSMYLELVDLRTKGITLPPPAPFRPFPSDHPRTAETAELLSSYGLERACSQLLSGEMWAARQDGFAEVRFRVPEGADQR